MQNPQEESSLSPTPAPEMTLEKALAELEKPRQERDTVQAVAQKWQQHEDSQKSELQLAQEKLAAAQQELGTTSAHAENTQGFACLSPAAGNYLRVRGEYVASSTPNLVSGELPSYARRILFSAYRSHLEKGTTSACAENTA